jgi:predicted  nucleic acid-binding Zn-ribbon protein
MTQSQIQKKIDRVSTLQEKIGEYDEQLTDAHLQQINHSSGSSTFIFLDRRIDSLSDKINDLEDKVYDIQCDVNDEHPEVTI